MVKESSLRESARAEIVRTLHRIFQTVDLFSRRMLRRFGVTGPQLWALRAIQASDSLTMSELAERMYLHASTVSGIVDRLEAGGLVRRRRSPADRRSVRLEITSRGRRILYEAPEPPRSKVVAGLRRLSGRDVRALRRAVRRLSRLMGVSDVDAAE